MCDCSDPSLSAAWREFADQKGSANWLLFQLEGGKKLEVAGSGSGGMKELLTKFDNARVMFGALKVIGKDVRQTVESHRQKIIFFTYIGAGVGALAKARVSVQRPDVEKIAQGYTLHINISGGDLEHTFTRGQIAKELLKCGGAHMPTHYVFGPEGDEFTVEELSKMD